MGSFNYAFWIQKMSDKSFQHCLSLLYPVMDYHYIEESEVRRVDLCEKLYELAKDYPMLSGYGFDKSYEAYYQVLKYSLEHYLKCVSDSIAEQYRSRALAIIKSIEDGKTDKTKSDDNLTLFAIYLGLSRSLYPNFTKYLAKSIDLFVREDDAELLLKLRDHKNKRLSQDSRKMVYMHNVIMYCLLMDAQGEYDEED